MVRLYLLLTVVALYIVNLAVIATPGAAEQLARVMGL